MSNDERCKERTFNEWHHNQCSRKAWKDGYCKQHHPDTVKAREEASNKKYEERKKQQPWYKLGLVLAAINDDALANASVEQWGADAIRDIAHHTIDTYRDALRERIEKEAQ